MIQTLIPHFVTQYLRCQGKIAHKLADILVIAVCAVIARIMLMILITIRRLVDDSEAS